MDPSLYVSGEGTVKTMDLKKRIGSKEGKDNSICWQGHGISFLDWTWDNFHWLFQKGKKINGEYYANLLQRLRDRIKKKQPYLVRKWVLFYQDNAPVHTSIIAMTKINEQKFELLLHAPYSPDSTPSDYFLFSNLGKWLSG